MFLQLPCLGRVLTINTDAVISVLESNVHNPRGEVVGIEITLHLQGESPHLFVERDAAEVHDILKALLEPPHVVPFVLDTPPLEFGH